MKKHLVTLMLAAVSLPALAQQFAIGIKAGPNFATMDVSDPGATYDNRTGWHGGAFVQWKFSKIAIQPEILFSQQGSKIKFDTQDLDANYSYVNIPIMVKLYTVAGINLQAGPQFGFLTKAESNYNPITGEPINSTEDFKEAYKKSDVSLSLGVGWDLPFGLTVDGRYNLGLSSVDDEAAFETKNQVWQVSVGFKLIKLGNNK